MKTLTPVLNSFSATIINNIDTGKFIFFKVEKFVTSFFYSIKTRISGVILDLLGIFTSINN